MTSNVLELAYDRFGCHVVQKAVERGEEEEKIIIIVEMLEQITESITHRFASHVWQRIFEIRWKTAFPLLYESVCKTLKGNWADIANDEHGSLVVQCIFENGGIQEKTQIIDEIFINLQTVSKGIIPFTF